MKRTVSTYGSMLVALSLLFGLGLAQDLTVWAQSTSTSFFPAPPAC